MSTKISKKSIKTAEKKCIRPINFSKNSKQS